MAKAAERRYESQSSAKQAGYQNQSLSKQDEPSKQTGTHAAGPVACIGLGKMGSGIARNIQSHGFQLIVYNRSAERCASFVAGGATAAQSPREAAAGAEVVVTSLLDDHSVFDLTSGKEGLLAGMRPGAVHIGTSTISPSLSRHLAEIHEKRGTHYVAGPVLGRPDSAASGQLLTLLAGSAEAIHRCQPVAESYASKVMIIGTDPGAASNAKLVANLIVAGVLELAAEAFVLAEKSQLKNEIPGELLRNLLGTHFQEYFDRIRERRYDPAGFALEAGLKDLNLISDAAFEERAVLPLAALIRDRLIAADANGFAGSDWCCLAEIARRQSGQPPLQRKASR